MAASLTPGVLLQLLDTISSSTTTPPPPPHHRPFLLQVLGIVPALGPGGASTHLSPNHGFYINLSDSSHSTHLSLPPEHDHLILSDKLQLGQLIHVDALDPASPLPLLRGVRPLPGRHKCVGDPQDLVINPSFSRSLRTDSAPSFSRSSRSDHTAQVVGGGGGGFNRHSAETFAAKLAERLSQKPLETDPSDPYPSSSSRIQEVGARGRSPKGRVVKSRVFDSLPSPRNGSNTPRSHSSSPMRRNAPPGESPKSRRRSSDVPVVVAAAGVASPRPRNPSPVCKRSSSTSRLPKGDGNSKRKSLGGGGGGGGGMRLSELMAAGSRSLRKSWEGAFGAKESKSSVSGAASTKVVKPDLKISIPIISSKPGLASPQPESVSRMKTTVTSLKTCPVPIEPVNRRLDETSWDMLPEGLAALGKDALQRRHAASAAAAIALQEASAVEEVIRSLNLFAELRSDSRPESPQPTVEKFLTFHRSLEQAAAVADALFLNQQTHSGSSDKPPVGGAKINFSNALSEEKARCAKSWVDSALACDLCAFTVHRKGQKLMPKDLVQPVIVLEGNSTTTVQSGKGRVLSSATPMKSTAQYTPSASPRRTALSSVTPTTNEKKELRAASPLKASNAFVRRNLNGNAKGTKTSANRDGDTNPVWCKGEGIKETADLAMQLRVEAQSWFFKFMEEALDKGFRSGIKEEINNSQLASILSQLKRVNDWLDQVASEKEDVPDLQLVETLARLKRKIYEFLLKHVESAACALGNGRVTMTT